MLIIRSDLVLLDRRKLGFPEVEEALDPLARLRHYPLIGALVLFQNYLDMGGHMVTTEWAGVLKLLLTMDPVHGRASLIMPPSPPWPSAFHVLHTQ